MEMVQIVQIPQGWRATAVDVDVRNSGGTALSRDLYAYKVYNYGTVGFSSLGSGTTVSEVSLSSTLDGHPASALMVVVHVSSTGDYVGGGYVKLTPVDGI